LHKKKGNKPMMIPILPRDLVLVAIANMRSNVCSGHTSIADEAEREGACAALTMLYIDMDELEAREVDRDAIERAETGPAPPAYVEGYHEDWWNTVDSEDPTENPYPKGTKSYTLFEQGREEGWKDARQEEEADE
jgi:hypothetical protein